MTTWTAFTLFVSLTSYIYAQECGTPTGPCVFPFKLSGIEYDGCTTESSIIPWCATSVNTNGEYVTYDYCSPTCKQAPTTTVAGGCSTISGVPCKFPFVYQGVTYNTCTTEGFGSLAWCATSTGIGNRMSDYGFCSASCPSESTVGSNECGTVANKKCIFPFVIKGKSYSTCTTVDSSIPWCATSVKPVTQEYVRYGYCNSNCQVSDVGAPATTPQTTPTTAESSTPESSKTVKTKAPGKTAKTTASGTSVKTKAPGKTATTTASGKSVKTKAPGKTATTTASGKSVKTKAPGKTATTTASGKSVKTKTSGKTATTTASGKSVKTKAPGKTATTTASGKSVKTKTSGKTATTTASGKSVKTKTSGKTATTTASGKSVKTKTSGKTATTTASGAPSMLISNSTAVSNSTTVSSMLISNSTAVSNSTTVSSMLMSNSTAVSNSTTT